MGLGRCRGTTSTGRPCRVRTRSGDCGRHGQAVPASVPVGGAAAGSVSDPFEPGVPVRVGELVDGFARLEPQLVESWGDPVGASARCTDAAERFRDWAWDNDLDATIRMHHDPTGEVRRPKGWAGRVGHVTVSVNGTTVDWTARQFWPDAPCPLIEPDDIYQARWGASADRVPQVR